VIGVEWVEWVGVDWVDGVVVDRNVAGLVVKAVDTILYSMVEVLDVIVDVSLEILNNPKSTTNKKDKDKSILVIDNLIGVDYHFWISKSNNGKLFLTINTSISHPRHLPKDKNDKKIIITKSGETIIREEFDLDNFTKITKGNIIIYYG
jgi:hypothetical protein